MNDFFKRLKWRVAGGLVTIGLGAFAAAQAQREGYIDEQPLPSLDAPAWAASLPVPIQAGPEQNWNTQDQVAQAAFAAQDSPQDSWAPQNNWVSPPEEMGYGQNEAELVAQVNHEQPASHQDPVAAPAMMMSMPEIESDSTPEHTDGAPEHTDGAPEHTDGPSMAMPMMGMPIPGNVPDAAPPEMAVPAMGMPAMAIPGPADIGPEHPAKAEAMQPQPVVTEAPAMQEIQFDHGPEIQFQTDKNAHNPHAGSPQGFVGDTHHVGGEANGFGGEYGPMNNSLRDPVAQDQPLRASPGFSPPSYEAGEPSYESGEPSYGVPQPSGYPEPQNLAHDSALPTLPKPNDGSGFANSPAYDESSSRRATFDSTSTPTRFAGHQRGGPSAMALPNQSFGAAPAANQYLESSDNPISISLPGDRSLEGVQTPSVVIHKRAPAEVKVGKAATFVIQVRNVGTAEALGVQVHDRIPSGMQLIDATPAPQMQGDSLVWQLGSMPVGDERAITMQLIPREEGELGSVARVTFEAAASVRTRSTRPQLKIVQQAPQKVLIGQQLEIELEISNIGTGEATGVILQEDVPQGLDHPRGRQLDNALGSLRPGETRREILRLRAAEPGMIQNVVRLTSEDAEEVSHSVNVEVVAPVLNVQLNGPSRRFLERQATYMVNIENRGTAPATNVEVIAYLDRGFTFVSTENNGHYDSNRHAVLWSVVNLPAGDSGSVPLTLLPVEHGEQAIRLEAVADLDTRSQSESVVSVESQAELTFSIADTADPIELGSETTYEIRVKNSGSRNDTNIQVRLQVPQGIELIDADAEVQTDGRGGVMFAPHRNLTAGSDMVYRVRVRGVQPATRT